MSDRGQKLFYAARLSDGKTWYYLFFRPRCLMFDTVFNIFDWSTAKAFMPHVVRWPNMTKLLLLFFLGDVWSWWVVDVKLATVVPHIVKCHTQYIFFFLEGCSTEWWTLKLPMLQFIGWQTRYILFSFLETFDVLGVMDVIFFFLRKHSNSRRR